MSLSFSQPLLESLRELGELKRVRSAGRPGSVAERLFLSGWSILVGGASTSDAAATSVASALAAARLGDLDLPTLAELGIERTDALGILEQAAHSMPGIAAGSFPEPDLPPGAIPAFARLLAEQPRAGVTCPGRPRLMLEPPENHAEHCLTVAVYGALLAPGFGADPATVWLAGMAHHLHNAFMPDAGFTGEMLLGRHLEPAMRRTTDRALRELPSALAARVEEARLLLPDAETPGGRAFHAADTLDRVWQIDQHLRAGRTSLRFVLDDMALVHDGPVKPFQDDVLRAAGLLP
ncbi:hypothetical protein [Rhizosaccharibacter radicis]|uniref:HD domain-containing protein n=1 Tax=Rhizosaccharibacter radicis TaxID=2782605 RepID=A0ABT1VWW3_9PROT|nr:HD domain-containing protein [Acetobacteraceae bacterium KSS12]